jgi:integrase
MPRHTTPVRRLPSGAWQLRYRDPEGRQRKETFGTSREAHARLDEVRVDVRRGRYVDPADGQVPFNEFARQWGASRDWAGTTRDGWPIILRRLEPHVGRLPLLAIDRLVLQAAQAALGERYARATVEVTMAGARSVMKAAYATGRIGRDPTVGLEAPKRRAGEPDGVVRAIDVPTRAEVRAILAGAAPYWRAAVALGVAGLRVGEVLAVSADRIDLERRRLTIDRQVQRIAGEVRLVGPKRDKVRTITLPGIVDLELRRHLRDHQGGGLLFRGGRGATMRRDYFYRQAWRPALVAAGLAPDRFKFHALRHFAASSMLAECAPPTAVAGHLGDTLEVLQRTYAHWLRDDAEVPASVLDRVLADDGDEGASRTS